MPDRTGGARRPLFRHPGRLAVVAVGLLVVINLVAWLAVTSDTGTTDGRLPTFVESVRPEPGDVVRLQETVSADLRGGRTGTLVINGVEIPPDQLERNEPLGIVSFRPGEGKDFTQWNPGEVTVQVLSWPATDERPANPDRYSWTFRAG